MSVSKPALISAESPPQRTACSPKRSVSHSSLKVVSMMPLRAPPMPLAQARPIVAGLAGGVLVDREQARHAAAFFELAADEVAGALGGDEDHVDVLRRRRSS